MISSKSSTGICLAGWFGLPQFRRSELFAALLIPRSLRNAALHHAQVTKTRGTKAFWPWKDWSLSDSSLQLQENWFGRHQSVDEAPTQYRTGNCPRLFQWWYQLWVYRSDSSEWNAFSEWLGSLPSYYRAPSNAAHDLDQDPRIQIYLDLVGLFSRFDELQRFYFPTRTNSEQCSRKLNRSATCTAYNLSHPCFSLSYDLLKTNWHILNEKTMDALQWKGVQLNLILQNGQRQSEILVPSTDITFQPPRYFLLGHTYWQFDPFLQTQITSP